MMHVLQKTRRASCALARSAACYFLPVRDAPEESCIALATVSGMEGKQAQAMAHFDGDAFARLCVKFSKAKERIIIRMFIWKGDATGKAVAGLLVQAADRGVSVNIRKDKMGDVFEWTQDFAGTLRDPDPVWRRFWNHPRITINHGNFHDHSKLLVVDDILFIGTMNIGDHYCHSWRECFVELQGSFFIQNALSQTIAVPGGAISILRSTKRFPMRRHICDLLENATSSIILVASYFSDPECIALLAKKSWEGIPVWIVIPDHVLVHHHANLAAVTRLLGAGNAQNIHIFRHAESLLHAKILIVDMKTICVGSANFTAHSLSGMGEANVLFREKPEQCVNAIRTVVFRMIRNSREAAAFSGGDLLHRSLGILQL